jgi:predicted nucleotidyltransferase
MTLLNILKTGENARKIFGRRELKIIEKQLLGISLTQSEKNRLSRDIRKKLEFIKELSRFSDEFNLKKASEIDRIVKEAKEEIIEDSLFRRIKRIILFGSAVENKLTFKSDIDIAVEFDKINVKEATLFRKRLLGKFHSRVDIQVYNVLPQKIKKQIDLNNKILYKK